MVSPDSLDLPGGLEVSDMFQLFRVIHLKVFQSYFIASSCTSPESEAHSPDSSAWFS